MVSVPKNIQISLHRLNKYTNQLHATSQCVYKPVWTPGLVPLMLGNPTQVPVGVLGSSEAVAWPTVRRKVDSVQLGMSDCVSVHLGYVKQPNVLIRVINMRASIGWATCNMIYLRYFFHERWLDKIVDISHSAPSHEDQRHNHGQAAK